MRIGAFELKEPIPKLREPHLFVILRPWIDVGSVGTLALATLEQQFDAHDLGKLARPSAFYDFTRYRPMLYRREGQRIVELPNTFLRYAQGPGDRDFLFMHILEPHMAGEDFIDSLVEVVTTLGTKRYCQVGAMYGSTPHTRPLVMSGQASEPEVQTLLDRMGIRGSNYEGPTSMMALATQELQKHGVGTMGVLVQLPPYARLDEDHRGQETLLRLLTPLYRINIRDLPSIAREGDRQYTEIDRMAQTDPRVQALIKQLESAYDAEVKGRAQGAQPGEPGEPTSLSPNLEQFLRELERGGGAP